MRLRIQAAEMSFLRRVSGLSLRDRVGSSDIWERLRVEPLLLCVDRSQLRLVWASGQDASWTSPWGVVSGMPIGEETLGQTEDTLERLYLSTGLGTSRCPTGRVGGLAGERSVWMSLLKLLHP